MKYLLFSLLFILAGCSTPPTITTYQPHGSTEPAWRVVANKSSSGDRVDVTINDSLVCVVDVGVMGSSDESKAVYKGHKVLCTLQRTTGWFGDGLQCLVMIDGELAGKFEWKD
jgi:hypothetical protein